MFNKYTTSLNNNANRITGMFLKISIILNKEIDLKN